MASSSNHHHQQQIWKYEVFLSFRGEDTRLSFVDHLYAALKQKGIHVFKDDQELERGKSISPELLKAIEESRFSIIIFSRKYAFSKWCLDELVKIMDCTKQTGHIAFPIFYNVNPSHVRKQTGKYGEAFLKHENEEFEDKIEKIQKWKAALTKVSNLSGWDSRNRHESDLIQEIVEEMFEKLNRSKLLCEDNIVGINFHMKEMNTLLSKDSNDVRFIGIYGLGGIGKTTIAKATYDRISYQFEGCSYLADVRESSKKHNGLINLQRQLLYKILKVQLSEFEDDKITDLITSRLRSKKVLVILDDVDHIDQLEGLAGRRDWFGSGSRIIITTRDEHLLDVHEVVERYKVKAIDHEKSLELFSLKAFKRNHPTEAFLKLSNDVVNYTKGLPLALKVLGSFLYGRNKTAWINALKKLEMEPNKEIVQILKISYDGLEDQQKEIFLDIACFFKGWNKEFVQKILDSCDFSADIGMQVLKERSLITISDNNEVLMHDLLQEMGRDIVRQECPKNPGNRSRLWLYEDICYVLNNNVGTEAVEAIMTNDFIIGQLDLNSWWSHDAFKKMYNLRLLKVSVCCPLMSIQIKLPKILKRLKFVQLNWFNCLTEIPDLTEVPNLEHLTIAYATKLSEIHTSVMLHKRLKHLGLIGSLNLRSLPSRIGMESLETLSLFRCTSLKELPSSINNIPGLKVLILSLCENLKCLPDSICRLKHLEELLLDRCWRLTKLPDKLGDLESLVKLDASETAIEEVPSSIVLLKNLTYLNLRDCNLSNGAIPDDIGSLSSLETLDLSENSFVELPSSICQLSQLTTFLLVGCKRIQALPELPSSIETILVDDCKSLERLSNPSTIFNSKNVHFGYANCFGILENQSSLSDAVQLLLHQALLGNSETFSITLPGNDISEWFTYQNEGSSIGLQLPSNWYNSKLRGLAFCVVADHTSWIRGPWKIVFSCNDSPMEIQIPCTSYERRQQGTDVELGYISRAWVRENGKGIMKALFEFKSEGLRVMKCGIHLVYGDDEREC